MISLTKIDKVIQSQGVSLAKKLTKAPEKCEQAAINLNLMPNYTILHSKAFLPQAFKALKEFQNEFGEVKSATYVCEQIKQAKSRGDIAKAENFEQTRIAYHNKIKELRSYLKTQDFDNFHAYVAELRKYLKKNGSYMNCGECSNLMFDILSNKGIKANNVLMFSTNKAGDRTSCLEHVFTVVGLNDKFDIKDPMSWGEAVICDGWAGIAMPVKEAVEYYKKFFRLDLEKQGLSFELLK